MSRSSSPLRRSVQVVAGFLVLTVVTVTGIPPAWANPTIGPVREIEAVSVDLHTGVSSLDGTVTSRAPVAGRRPGSTPPSYSAKDSAKLHPGARERIRQVAKEFSRKGPGNVRVVGYTDDLGPADHGLRPSIRRAGAVANTLSDLLPRTGAVSSGCRLTSMSFGVVVTAYAVAGLGMASTVALISGLGLPQLLAAQPDGTKRLLDQERVRV